MDLLSIVFFQIQFTESALCVLISNFSRLFKAVYRLSGILCNDLTLEIFLAEPIGCAVASIVSGILQPLHPQLRIVNFWVVGEQNLSHFILRYRMALSCRQIKPIERLYTVRD